MAQSSFLDHDSSPVLEEEEGEEKEKDEEENDAAPLLGVVLCCTSILPEQRVRENTSPLAIADMESQDLLCDIAREMGATTNLDLTSAVTHLIVGNVDTAKYQYVAKERPDVYAVDVSWLHAVHSSWIEGDSIDLDGLTEKYRASTFFNLSISITGFEDREFRTSIRLGVSRISLNANSIHKNTNGRKHQTQWRNLLW